jgi:hypothetical protein
MLWRRKILRLCNCCILPDLFRFFPERHIFFNPRPAVQAAGGGKHYVAWEQRTSMIPDNEFYLN